MSWALRYLDIKVGDMMFIFDDDFSKIGIKWSKIDFSIDEDKDISADPENPTVIHAKLPSDIYSNGTYQTLMAINGISVRGYYRASNNAKVIVPLNILNAVMAHPDPGLWCISVDVYANRSGVKLSGTLSEVRITYMAKNE